jgi:catechol 2,3-dioxygenase-like lactoylglutathione lyase family enzyme
MGGLMKSIEITMFTHKVAAMAEFYERLLGVEPIHKNSDIALLRTGSVTLLIHVIRERGEGGLPFEDHIALAVDDIDAASDDLKKQGVIFEREAETYSWGRSAYLRDPDGRLVEINSKREN